MTNFCDKNLLGWVAIVKKINLGKIAEFKKLIFFKIFLNFRKYTEKRQNYYE